MSFFVENSSLIAESEREPNTLYNSAAVGYISRNKNRPRRVQIPKENIYITSPFKQGPEKDVKGPALVRPIVWMKKFLNGKS